MASPDKHEFIDFIDELHLRKHSSHADALEEVVPSISRRRGEDDEKVSLREDH